MNCALCGHAITDSCGSAGAYEPNQDYKALCHPNTKSGEHLDCYHLYTVYGARSMADVEQMDFSLAGTLTRFTERIGLATESYGD